MTSVGSVRWSARRRCSSTRCGPVSRTAPLSAAMLSQSSSTRDRRSSSPSRSSPSDFIEIAISTNYTYPHRTRHLRTRHDPVRSSVTVSLWAAHKAALFFTDRSNALSMLRDAMSVFTIHNLKNGTRTSAAEGAWRSRRTRASASDAWKSKGGSSITGTWSSPPDSTGRRGTAVRRGGPRNWCTTSCCPCRRRRPRTRFWPLRGNSPARISGNTATPWCCTPTSSTRTCIWW